MAHLSGGKSRASWSVQGGAANLDEQGADPTLGESAPALRTRNQYISPEQARVRQYRNSLQAYSFQGVAGGLKNAVVKGEMLCPVTFDANGKKKPMKAYKLPIPDWDKALRQQWPITRKDMFNRTVTLFCYPDGEFDGYNFNPASAPDGQQPVDLDDYKYVASVNASDALSTLSYLLHPKNSISKLERDRAAITALAVDFANEADILRAQENAIPQLAKILASCQKYAGMPSSLKVANSEKEAKQLIDTVHAVAIASLTLDISGTDDEKKEHCEEAGGAYDTYQAGNVKMEGCIAQATLDNVDNNSDFITPSEKIKVKKFLLAYSNKITELSEKVKERNWREAFLRLPERNRRLISK